jgi:hypothetical protein
MTKLAFEPHRVSKGQIKALKKDILITDMLFDTRITQSGIILPNDNGTSLGIRPRWGRVYAIGAEQKSVKIGNWILVAHGRWTRGIDIEDESGPRTLRKIDPKDILLVSDADEMPSDSTMSTAVHIQKQQR